MTLSEALTDLGNKWYEFCLSVFDEFFPRHRREMNDLIAENRDYLEILQTVILDHNELMHNGHPVTVRMSTIAEARKLIIKAAFKGRF